MKKQVSVEVASKNAEVASKEIQLAKIEQFIRQLHAVERRSEGDAVKAAICQGLALNFAKPLLSGAFTQWAADRFPEIGQTRQHYYRKLASDFQRRTADRLPLPDYRDRQGVTAMMAVFSGGSEADRMMDEYIGERSMCEILHEIGARPQTRRGGFAPDVVEAAAFVGEERPDLNGVRTSDWDDEAVGQFGAWRRRRQASPADTERLQYEAAKHSFDHALARISELVSGSTPRYQRLSPDECAEVARQLRAFAAIVARCATRQAKSRAAKAAAKPAAKARKTT